MALSLEFMNYILYQILCNFIFIENLLIFYLQKMKKTLLVHAKILKILKKPFYYYYK